ncbi:MAG: DNA polymerase III subunit chi [Gluconacetobacter diazotrophicus]|nr:DNA polymerase III subunit chi [Gluconacetobacter diazotrophicus]
MTAIGFYHLTRSSLEEALGPLLERTLDGGARAVVWCPDRDRVSTLDAALWRTPEPSWIPHGTAADGHPTLQPIWLTAEADAPNGAGFLFLVGGRELVDPERFRRAFDLFDGNDPAAVEAARRRWSRYKAEGHELAYWRQEPKRWVRAG